MQSNPEASRNPHFPAGLASFIFVLAGHGGEENVVGDAEIREDGDDSANMKHQYGNLYIAASLCRSDLWLAGANSSYELYCYMSGCYTLHLLQAIGHEVCVSLLFGTCRRWVRAPLLRLLRFNGKDPPDLSSVMAILNLQLNPLPHWRLTTGLPVEPLALRLARLQETLEECNCRFVASEFSTDPLAGSYCVLRHNLHVSPVVHFICTQLGNITFWDERCNHDAVISYYIMK